MDSVIAFLPSTWETWVEFLAPGSCPLPATASILGNEAEGRSVFSLAKKINILNGDEACRSGAPKTPPGTLTTYSALSQESCVSAFPIARQTFL